MSFPSFDIIGDIHGEADALRRLLSALGYVEQGRAGYISPPGRRALFVGDYIDRGPAIADCLRLVRAMVDSGNAIALLGNHEYNALALNHYANGLALRSQDKWCQHKETHRQLCDANENYGAWLDWFRTLPLFFESASLRVVHACWDENHIGVLRRRLPDGCLPQEAMDELFDKSGDLWRAVNCTLKGKEAMLPLGRTFCDTDGRDRSEMRIKWWSLGKCPSWREAAFENLDEAWAGESFDVGVLDTPWIYPPGAKPVFCGHYGLSGEPRLLAGNVCCVDYSVAKAGSLAAIRWGTGALSNGAFVKVPASCRVL